jgi:hypothetical protein
LTDRLAELRAVLEAGEEIYANGSFSLRHEVDRTKSARPGRWSKLVPAPRLELGTGHDNVANLRCIISAALEEIERGQTRHAKSILITLKEVLS